MKKDNKKKDGETNYTFSPSCVRLFGYYKIY